MADYAYAMMENCIEAAFLIVVVILIRFLLRNRSKTLSLLLWPIVALRLMLLVSIPFPFSVIKGSSGVISGTPLDLSMYSKTLVSGVANYVSLRSELSLGGMCYVWLIGAMICTLYLLVPYVSFRRKIRASVESDRGVRICDDIESPCIAGLIHPKIYVPSDLPTEYTKFVCLHEEAHIRRKDQWWKLLATMLLIVYWFHPLVWVAYVLYCKDLEYSCDEKVVQELGLTERKAYANTLLFTSTVRKRRIVYATTFSTWDLKSRVQSILNPKKRKPSELVGVTIAVLIMGILFLTTPVKGSVQVSDTLNKAITKAIIENSQIPEEYFPCEAHHIFRVTSKGSQTVVYLVTLYEGYSCKNGALTSETGARLPLILTFQGDEQKGYTVMKYWYPGGGSSCVRDIRANFPIDLWQDVLTDNNYSNSLSDYCRKQAKEHFQGQS